MTLAEALARLNVQVDHIPASASNRPGTRIRATHLTIHNTANAGPGADALMHARYLKGPDARAREVSWHFTVDDVRCIKHLPTNEKAWHAGSGNNKSVAIEICEHAGIDEAAATERASLLTAMLMDALNIPPERVVPHQFWTGKNCPHIVLGGQGGFDAFRERAVAHLEELHAGPSLGPSAAAPADVRGASEMPFVIETEAAVPGGTSFAPDAGAVSDPTALSDRDRIANLERIVGRLTMENEWLRTALADAHDRAREAE